MKKLKVDSLVIMLGAFLLGFSDQSMFDVIGAFIIALAAFTFFRDGFSRTKNNKELTQAQSSAIKTISFLQVIIGMLIIAGGIFVYWLKINKYNI